MVRRSLRGEWEEKEAGEAREDSDEDGPAAKERG